MDWTNEQKSVIQFRNGDLLVSAAAGSGKTAVLIEHILSRITEEDHPVSITDLLVVTFTRAAAEEMRSRLNEKLAQKLDNEPENYLLQRQLTLVPQAHISTIDSFCGWLVRSHFHQLDIDPDYRVIDEGERKLMQEEAVEEVLEEAYETAEEDFVCFMDCFASEKNDDAVKNMIQKLAGMAESQPWPFEWLEQLPDSGKDWISALMGMLKSRLAGISFRAGIGRREASLAYGLDKYTDLFVSDEKKIQEILDMEDPASMLQCLGNISLDRAPRLTKKDSYDPALKDRLSAWRKDYRKDLNELREAFGMDPGEEEEHNKRSNRMEKILIRLTKRYMMCFADRKRRGNLADFSDVEHMALDLLIRREDGISHPTPLASELGQNFCEIIIDEYQDSNMVQEQILRALSGADRGQPNMFMVGDVKQSIYRFRMARPELFMEKYRRYFPLPSAGERSLSDSEGHYSVDLGKNFRSREGILQSVNQVFRRIMREEFGGIHYDNRAMLNYGAFYQGEDPDSELVVLPKDSYTQPEESEAGWIAARIREMMNPDSGFRVWDAGENCLRAPAYRDFVILLRSAEGWAQTFAEILNQQGIPAYAQLKNGYFSAQEVQILLHFLRILDNPRQDIPLASVLLSPIGGFTEEMLAGMLAGTPAGDLYSRLSAGASFGRYQDKWAVFLERLERYRDLAPLRPIHETLEEILTETGSGLMFAARPEGSVRSANIEMLMEMAMRFEETSYRGIFRFLRYIDRLEKYSQDFGEAQILSERDDLVRITTIHKSKGLEYPVVFLAGCGKSFNLQDARDTMQMHEKYGLACDDIHPEKGIRWRTMRKRTMSMQIAKELKSEELRLLYVAMTRAKEKLILVGSAEDPKEAAGKWSFAEPDPSGRLPVFLIESASSYLDLLLMAQASYEEGIFSLRLEEMTGYETEEHGVSSAKAADESIKSMLAGPVPNDTVHEKFQKILSWEYPEKAAVSQKPVFSVSELKRLAANPEPEKIKEERGDRQGKKGEGGAARGTLYHMLLEKMPPATGTEIQNIRNFIDSLVKDGTFTQREAEMIDPCQIRRYYHSPLGKLAIESERQGRFRREQIFMMKVPITELPGEEGTVSDDWVLVQGIIDAAALTEKGWILWDYKTDRVSEERGEEILLGRYREQLRHYRQALEQASGMPVYETWIYSFALRKAIPIVS